MSHTDNRTRAYSEYRHLCSRAARKFLRPGLERCDLEQVAAIGLIKAADRYDDAQETPFEAFAWLFVIGELMHHVRDYERIVRPPRRYRELEKRWQRTYDAMVGELGREPAAFEVAARMNVSVTELEQLQIYRERAVPEALDTFHANTIRSSNNQFEEREERWLIEAALDALSEKEREIVVRLYDYGYSQTEVASRLGYSQRHISRLHRSALRKMQPVWVHKSAETGTERGMKSQRGFTLLEMMIVVAIIAILAMLLIPNFTHARAQAQTAACESNLRAIGTAMELYYTDNQGYPSGTAVSLDGTDLLATKGYLPNVPHDPAAASGASNLYKYSTVAASGSTPASYTVTCPGIHDPSTLAQIQHATASSTGLFYHSGDGLDTR